MARTCLTIILAAGEGSRMKSNSPKVLHKVAHKSLLGHVMFAAKSAGGEGNAVVVGRDAKRVEAEAKTHAQDADVYLQTERLGTGHAVLAAKEAIERGYDDVLILFGDTPLLEPKTLLELRETLANGADVVVLGFKTDDPTGYGRLVEENGKLVAIREHKDASESEKLIDFCNGGMMGISGKHIMNLLNAIDNKNANNEYYLTDVVEIAHGQNMSVVAIEADETQLMGVNDRAQLAQIETIWQETKRTQLLRSGVTMQDPSSVFLAYDTIIEPDANLEPNVVFGPNVEVKAGAQILAFSHIEGATIGENAVIGPFARLRPGTQLAKSTKVGNFVEIKKAIVEEGAKVNHLTYIGDAHIKENANIGAGTITCNYDGMNKHLTQIGKDAFIGSNSSLVAPVKIGDGAFIGSGSVVTQDVPDNDLAIARSRQTNKSGFGEEIRKRTKAIKDAKSKS
ncbi:MAG: bifunctional UDP-N-acetylglucosamine diphosphorylase/glucosamine-1-phosphate N-acetyltransferase GlmU [Nitratireductor sp.]